MRLQRYYGSLFIAASAMVVVFIPFPLFSHDLILLMLIPLALIAIGLMLLMIEMMMLE